MQIVIAWADKTGLKKTERFERRDGVNWFPVFEPDWEPHAVMWLNDGTEEDLEKARLFLKTINAPFKDVIFTDEWEPLKSAKDMIMRRVRKKVE